MSKAKPNSRWGGTKTPRYSDAERDLILRKYREHDGWHKGARVRKASRKVTG